MDETNDAHASCQAQVTIYTRPGCHLCDEAKRVILAAACPDQFSLREINIDHDPDLVQRYGWDVPVIIINGIETFKHRLNTSEFEREIRRAIDTRD